MERQEERLTHLVTFRVSESFYRELQKIHTNSDCGSVGEVARRIISKEKITVFYKDSSADAAMEELSAIRKELNAIGVNINQVTRHFNIAGNDKQRLFFALKSMDLYRSVDAKINQLFTAVSKLTVKWLQS